MIGVVRSAVSKSVDHKIYIIRSEECSAIRC